MGEPWNLSDAYRRLNATALPQGGVIGLDQLRQAGLSARAAQRRAANGQLHRVYQSVYSLVPPELLSGAGHFMAAVLACGDGAVLSHRSAADLHDLRPTARANIDVTVPGHRNCHIAGIEVHRSKTLTAADITTVHNIPCTTIARTQLDIADVLRRRQVERAIEQAQTLEVFDLRALEDQLSRNPTRRGAAVLAAILADLDDGAAPTESALEEGFLALVRGAGLPTPRRQHHIVLDDGEPPIRADFAWPEHRLAVETDGRRYHTAPNAFERDRRRDQRLALTGWRVIRLTWRQVTQEQRRIATLLARLLRPA
jgi:hypothetical protein